MAAQSAAARARLIPHGGRLTPAARGDVVPHGRRSAKFLSKGRADMAYSLQPKKMLALNLLELLRKYSDENHRLSQQELLRLLESEYGMTADRKSVRRNLLELQACGYPVCSDERPRAGADGARPRPYPPRSAAFGVQAVPQLCFRGGIVNPHRLNVRRADRVANPVAAGCFDSRCPAVRRAGRSL